MNDSYHRERTKEAAKALSRLQQGLSEDGREKAHTRAPNDEPSESSTMVATRDVVGQQHGTRYSGNPQ